MPLILSPNAPIDRPGVSVVIKSAETPGNPARGVAGYVGRARIGPLNTPVRCTSPAQVSRIFGGGPFGSYPDGDNTMDGASHALVGGAVAVEVVRCGVAGTGTASTVTLSGGGSPSIKVDASSVGTGGDLLFASVLGLPNPTQQRQFVVSRNFGEEVLEQFTYICPDPATTDEADVLLQAMANQGGSAYVVVSKAGPGLIDEYPATPLTGGTNPTINNQAYSDGLAALSGSAFEVCAIDGAEAALRNLFLATLDEWNLAGKLVLGISGCIPGTPLMTAQNEAIAINNPGMVYVYNGFKTRSPITGQGDDLVEGYEAFGREAGRHAALPLARQLTHAVVRDSYVTINEPPADEVGGALMSGLYCYTTAPNGSIWTEQGITSQTDFSKPPPWAVETDSGWSKSRLVLTRFRLINDILLALSPMIETTTNNAAGRASIIRQAQNVIDTQYIPVGAVDVAKVILDPSNPPTGDKIWLLIDPCITPDGAEKIIMTIAFKR